MVVCAMQGPWTGPSLIAEGQSLNNVPVRPRRWIDFVMRDLDRTQVRRFVAADSGEAWSELDDDLSTRILHMIERSSLPMVVMQGGQKNLAIAGQSGSGLYTTVSNYAALLRAANPANARIIYTTVPPAEAWVGTSIEDERVAHNALALADDLYPTGPFDAVVDTASVLALGVGDYSDDPELHFSVQGARKFAQPIIPVVQGFLP